MSDINYKELFEHYYQKDYDFNTSSLSAEQIKDIKQTARQMRVDYALAPMGTSIFNWILNQNSNIRFELVPFDSENIDGMLYVPTTGKDCAYIILNVNKPLINQIFTAAHEFYHYIKDYKKMAEDLGIGEITLRDIIKELQKPGRDPREDMPAPILRSDVLDMKDLKPGMILKGTVRNVIDFGVFVDIGVHQDGLVHISQITDRFIKHPLEAVSVGDIVDVKVLDVDLAKKRISLTMRLDQETQKNNKNK